MKLTGKCKLDFEKWFFFSKEREKFMEAVDIRIGNSIMGTFYKLPNSMKYGVMVDFFDSVGIGLQIYATDYPKWFLNILQKGRYLTVVKETFKSRQEAREQAIEKANEIYNLN